MPGIPRNSGHLGSKWTPGFVKSCQLELANCSPTFAGNSVEFRANRDLQAKSCQLRFENSSLWVAGFWFYSLDLPDFPWNSWQIGGGKSPTLVGGILKIWWKWVEKNEKIKTSDAGFWAGIAKSRWPTLIKINFPRKMLMQGVQIRSYRHSVILFQLATVALRSLAFVRFRQPLLRSWQEALDTLGTTSTFCGLTRCPRSFGGCDS